MDIISDYIFRIILIGDSSSGKSSFLTRFCTDIFDPNSGNTVGVDFKTKLVKLEDGKIAKFQIWDTAGQENFYSICKNYYHYTAAAFLFYDITNKESFDNVPKWINRAKENNKNYESDGNGIIFLIGNKADLEEKREVSFDNGIIMAQQNRLLFSEISCKTGTSVYSVGERLANKIYEQIKQGKVSVNDTLSGVKNHSVGINNININTKMYNGNGYCC